MSDFYEEDEPPAKIMAAFDQGDKRAVVALEDEFGALADETMEWAHLTAGAVSESWPESPEKSTAPSCRAWGPCRGLRAQCCPPRECDTTDSRRLADDLRQT